MTSRHPAPAAAFRPTTSLAHAKQVIASTGGARRRPRPPRRRRSCCPTSRSGAAIDRQPMRAIRRKTAEHLVTRVEPASRTSRRARRPTSPSSRRCARSSARRPRRAGGKLTVTAVTLKVVAAALKKFPQFNASIDMAGEAVIYKQYVHIGVAVDTDRGLLVPVIRDVDKKGILRARGRAPASSPRRRAAASCRSTRCRAAASRSRNLGGIGGTHFTPIVNHPEVGDPRHVALADGAGVEGRPVRAAPDAAAVAVLRSPHRSTAPTAIRFLRFIVDALEQPFLLVLQ